MEKKNKICNHKENNYVVKANKFIEAKGKLGTIEQKLLATLISEITPQDEDFKEYSLKVQSIGEFINLSEKHMYEQIKNASRNLRNKEIVIENINEKGKKVFLVTGLLSSATYVEGQGYLQINIDPNLKPYLLAIKGTNTPFTQYMIKNILKLNRSYSIRLYEILKQWEYTKKIKFEIQNLKDMLGANAKSYNLFAEFERKVLKPAKEEINEHTDLFIIYEKLKTGRRISHINFNIQSKINQQNKEKKLYKKYEDEKIFDYEFIKINSGMAEENFSRKQILELYTIAIEKTSKYQINELDYIKINYEYTKKRAKTGIFTYLKKSLENDYARAILQLNKL